MLTLLENVALEEYIALQLVLEDLFLVNLLHGVNALVVLLAHFEDHAETTLGQRKTYLPEQREYYEVVTRMGRFWGQ